MINCAIIGFGKMGQIRANALEYSGRAKVVGVYDICELKNGGYKIFDSDHAIINDSTIDAVFICTPNYRIAPLCISALTAGKHVFSEKPPAMTTKELEDVLATEKSSNKVLMYGFNHRHHESIKKIKMIVDRGEMGKILWMRGRYGKEVDHSYFDGWRANPSHSGGGIMFDQGIHMLDLFVHLAGDFDEVQSMVSNLFWKIEGIEDNVFAQFRSNKTGICASLHSTMTQWRYIFSLEVFMEQGALILNGLKTNSGAYGDEQLAIKYNRIAPEEGRFESEIQQTYHINTSWESEIKDFLDAIIENKPIRWGTSQDALTIMKLMDKIYDRSGNKKNI